jgi:hypothetical protein
VTAAGNRAARREMLDWVRSGVANMGLVGIKIFLHCLFYQFKIFFKSSMDSKITSFRIKWL